ncbi:TPA: hypothetical protein EYP66_08665 [Candidatus Poribacteria bacterium]|nr:hypothetical protein [Candidatus Poribacteria bacterium]
MFDSDRIQMYKNNLHYWQSSVGKELGYIGLRRNWTGWSISKIFGKVNALTLAILLFMALGEFAITATTNKETKMANDRIQIYQDNPRYWQYKGRPLLLLGGSVEDNLFQIPNLKEHLDLLKSVGGNYVRCTMSCRDEGNVWQFKKHALERSEGMGELYDLEQWNEEFWRRFSAFLELTAERDIIVQIEIWATFDYYRDNWEVNPFNPKNNSAYSVEETGLPEVVDSHPVRTENNFFWSVPKENNQQIVLKYQQKFVDKILSYSLKYGHVLYCMDNETSVTPAWGEYWATYIKRKAAEAGTAVETTEMWDAWEIFHPQHKATLDHPEIYSFCDISQNNHQKGETHWNNAQKFRASLSPIRPINNVKIYGSDQGRFGDTQDGLERFWRNIFGGMASSRFHRPDSGQGLNENAQAHIKSMRMLTDSMDIFTCEPHNDLLSNRKENSAYATANPGKEYAVYFPNGDPVDIDLRAVQGSLKARWLDIGENRWAKEETLTGGDTVTLSPPGTGHWAALISR